MTIQKQDSAFFRRAAWGGILTVVTVVSTLAVACGMPFAALGTLAALYLPRRDAFVLIGVNWIANQAIGFGFLHYPLNWDCYRGGINLLAAAVAGTAAAMLAQQALRKAGAALAVIGAFAAAFVTYEVLLFAITPWRSGGDFAMPVVRYILYVNAIAFAGLLLLQTAAIAVGLAAPRAVLWKDSAAT
ncbi:MAG: hypothetical protein M3N91_05910 [Pseudomonadota bacterium]|nr:hypothetical protein [Pseudomonadota bacterium]